MKWQIRVFTSEDRYEVKKLFKTQAAALAWLRQACLHPHLLIVENGEILEEGNESYTCAIPWSRVFYIDVIAEKEGQ